MIDRPDRANQPASSALPDSSGPLRSAYAHDPEMSEIIGLFVRDMPTTVENLRKTFQAGDTRTLERIAHQLKGSGAGYGFTELTVTAGALERLLRMGPEPDLPAVKRQVDQLIDLCTRVTSG